MIKPHVWRLQQENGVISIDDSIFENPNTAENEVICWYYDHAKGCTVKGIHCITALYMVDGISLPMAYRLVMKTELYIEKDGKQKRQYGNHQERTASSDATTIT